MHTESDQTPVQLVCMEVYRAIHNQAPIHWIADYVEYFSEGHQDTFAGYLQFQVQTTKEDILDSNSGFINEACEYQAALLNYLERNTPCP